MTAAYYDRGELTGDERDLPQAEPHVVLRNQRPMNLGLIVQGVLSYGKSPRDR